MVTRLSPSISNFQLCSCGAPVFGQAIEISPQITKFYSYISIKLILQNGNHKGTSDTGSGQVFHILVRVNPGENISSQNEYLLCDVRVRQLPIFGNCGNETQSMIHINGLNLNEDDTLIGYHLEDMLLPNSSPYTYGDGKLQAELLKSSTMRSMKIIMIFNNVCDIPNSDSMSWVLLLPEKILDVLSTYNLHLKSNTLVDLRKCPLAATSSIAFIFIQSCTMKNATDENVIGRVGAHTKIRLEGSHDIAYYLRQVTAARVKLNQNIFENTSSSIYTNLRDLILLHVQMKEAFDSKNETKTWHGILLAGPSGCGKNMLVQELSRRLAINLIQFNFANELITSLNQIIDHDSGCEKLESVFDKAIQSAKKYPTILLLQQVHILDSNGATSTRSTNTKMKLIVHLCRLFQKISTVSTKTPLILTVIGTTGQPQLVCAQLRMFGRFEQEMYISLPTERERLEIVKFLTADMKEFQKLDLALMARAVPGYTRAELAKLVHAVRVKLTPLSRNRDSDAFVEMSDVEQCIKNIHPAAMKGFLVDTLNVKWDDIGGQMDLKLKLKQCIEWPLKHEEAFKRLGISPPRGVLMYGPPGCSKTMIARALASECGVNFFSVNGSELFSQWVGDSEKAVRSLFREARQVSPCIIFFDEIDSIVGERGSSSKGASSVHERVIAQLLIEIDGVEAMKGVTIVAATNRPDKIDPALLRPGRLDRIVYVPLPDASTRREIFSIHFRKMPTASDVDVEKLVHLTKGYSGAEVAAVCHEAALKSLEENTDAEEVHHSHFVHALNEILPGTTRSQVELYENYNMNQST